MNSATYWFSARLALAMARARPVARSVAPLLHAQVEDVAARAGIPPPAVHLIHAPSPNACATGRNPRACYHRRHDGPPRAARPAGAVHGAGARVRAHHEPGHLADHGRGHEDTQAMRRALVSGALYEMRG
jgi:Zn-dependent protease with chaperone function